MRGTQCIPDEHRVAAEPPFIPDIREVAPYGPVGGKCMPLEGFAEKPLRVPQGFRLRHALEPGADPSRGIALEDEGAHALGVTVMMSVERAMLVFDERLRERREQLGRAEPGKLVAEGLDGSAEF